MIIKGQFSTVLHKNICCGYSLESPQFSIKTYVVGTH